MGRTQCFAPVRFSGVAEPGSFITVRITGARDKHLIGNA